MGTVGLRDFRPEPQKSFELLHGHIDPYDVRGEDHIFVEVKGEHLHESHAPVWRISPVGIEIILPDRSEDVCDIGSPFQIQLHIGRQVCHFDSLLVSAISSSHDGVRLGFRWFESERQSDFTGQERRRERRWICPDEFLPTGVAVNPAKFNDYIYFRIINISKQGMLLVTSLRNKFIVPQMVLEPIISWPMTGQTQTKVRVVRTDIRTLHGKECLFVGVTCIGADNATSPNVAQYMLQFGSAESILELHRAGFRPDQPSRGMSFSYVRNAEQYRDVLALRKRNYIRSGKLPKDITEEELSDEYDTRSRILLASYKQRAIGTLRMMFHEYNDRMEIEEFVTLPENFPRREQCVEVTRFCVDPEFRSLDVMCEMFKYVAMVVLQAKRRWILTSCMSNRFWLYKAIGAQDTGLTYQHQRFGGKTHLVFLIDIPRAMAGWNMNPVFWNRFYTDLFQYAKDTELLDLTPSLRFRVGLNKVLEPVFTLIFKTFYAGKR